MTTTTAAFSEPLSPELALVDPVLSERARALLVDAVAVVAPPRPRSPGEAMTADTDIRAAVLRISELSEVNPPRKLRPQFLKVVGVGALWIEAVVLALDLRFGLL